MNYWLARCLHVLGTITIYVGSASLTFIFFQGITPAGLWWFPLAAIGLFEGGIIHWSGYHLEVAENPQQAIVSVFMVGVSILGVTVSTAFELVRMLAPTFGLSLGWMNYSLWLIVFIFPINVLANRLCKLLSNEHQDVWQSVFERTGDRPSMRPIKIGRFSGRKGTVKEIAPADDRKQLDGATEPIEQVDMSNLSQTTPVKKKLPPVKVR